MMISTRKKYNMHVSHALNQVDLSDKINTHIYHTTYYSHFQPTSYFPKMGYIHPEIFYVLKKNNHSFSTCAVTSQGYKGHVELLFFFLKVKVNATPKNQQTRRADSK